MELTTPQPDHPTTRPITKAERVTGAMVGLLVGDALGVPYEFHPASALPAAAFIEMQPPEGFRRSHPHVPPGTWSDDGAQALCLLASLLFRNRLDLDDFGCRLLNWRDVGYLAVAGDVFDVGAITEQALAQLRAGVPAERAGPASQYANGNGALMRVMPLALWHKGSDVELTADAQRSSLVTHGHIRSQICCAVYCLWARRILENHPAPWDAAVAFLRAHYAAASVESAELNDVILGSQAHLRGGSGYVVDCLHSARWASQQGDFEAAVRSAIALGNDTDTTACVTGGIAGLLHGLDSIPQRWRASLRNLDEASPLITRLVERATT